MEVLRHRAPRPWSAGCLNIKNYTSQKYQMIPKVFHPLRDSLIRTLCPMSLKILKEHLER